MTITNRFLRRAAMLAAAGLATGFASTVGAVVVVTDPCTVAAFNSCYIGVDGTDTQTLNTTAGPYNFVGLGVIATEPGITPPSPPNTGPVSGTLNVNAGGSISLNYLPGTIGAPTFRPVDNSVLLGVSGGSAGTLNVNGGSVTTPILIVGNDFGRPASTGTASISGGGKVTATLDSGSSGPIPGYAAVNIGRGAGSTGTVTVAGAGSELNVNAGNGAIQTSNGGHISVGRSGSGSLSVLDGGQVLGSRALSTIFGSTSDPAGTSSILVDGAGSKLTANQILLGVGLGPFPGGDFGALPVPDFNSPNHGTGTLNVRNGGEVVANVSVGAGGTLRGNGTITGNVTSTGTVAPGNSPGTLKIAGDFTQTGGVLEIQIANATDFDIVDVDGFASLNNVLIEFLFIDGYAPTAGTSFNFLQVGPGSLLTNVGATYQYSGLQPGFEYAVTSDNGAMTLVARNNGVAVPEPGTLALLLAGLSGFAVRRRAALRHG